MLNVMLASAQNASLHLCGAWPVTWQQLLTGTKTHPGLKFVFGVRLENSHHGSLVNTAPHNTQSVDEEHALTCVCVLASLMGKNAAVSSDDEPAWLCSRSTLLVRSLELRAGCHAGGVL